LQEHNREKKKKIKDTHKEKFEGTKENDFVNYLNRRILDARALDLDVAVGSRSTTTHGRVGFVEAASVLFSNKFAQQQKTTIGARRKFWQRLLLCHSEHAQVTILGDDTQELTIAVTNGLLDELIVTVASFTPTGVVAGGRAARVAT
jgi:hypothetical protein